MITQKERQGSDLLIKVAFTKSYAMTVNLFVYQTDIKVILILDLIRNMMTKMKLLEDKKANLFYYDKRVGL